MLRQNGYTSFHNGTTFSRKKREKNYIRNKKIPELSARKRRLEETIHVHAEVVKNIKNAVVNNLQMHINLVKGHTKIAY